MIAKNCTTFRPETRTHVSIHLFNCLYSYRLITMLNGLMSQLQRLFISSIIQIAFLWNRIPSYICIIDLDILWYESPITCRFLMKAFWTMDTTNNNGSRIFAILVISLVWLYKVLEWMFLIRCMILKWLLLFVRSKYSIAFYEIEYRKKIYMIFKVFLSLMKSYI